MKNPYKSKPKAKKTIKKRVLSVQTKLPKENEPATTIEVSPKKPTSAPAPTKPQNTISENPAPAFEETKLLPVKFTISLDNRMELAKTTEAIKRRVTGQRKFSKTDLVNEAVTQWLNQNGY